MIICRHGINDLRGVPEIQYFHKPLAPSFGRRNGQGAPGEYHVKEPDLAGQRSLSQNLSEERTQTRPKEEKEALSLRAYFVYNYFQLHGRCF